MNKIEPVPMNYKNVHELKERLLELPKIFGVKADFEFSSWLISYGISREIGSANDELSRFIFNKATGQLIQKESLRAEVIKIENKYAVRIYSISCSHLEVRIRGFRDLCHPELSENPDGSYLQIIICPEVVSKLAELQGIELVIVQPWALNSIFGGFDKSKGYYETNFWELENNDSVLFASLVANRQLAFLGTHDLIAHVAGVKGNTWAKLIEDASKVKKTIENFIASGRPSIANLILPYTAGVILDDLAQPPSYLSPSHTTVLNEVLQAMSSASAARCNSILLKYPSSFEKVIQLSRKSGATQTEARKVVRSLVAEIEASIVFQY